MTNVRTTAPRPKQGRSHETQSRIVDAARALTADRPFDELSIAEIARRARVSVGGFYARFPSKDSLALHLVNEGFVDELLARARHVLDDARVAKLSTFDLIRLYVAEVAVNFRKHRAILRPVALRSREHPSSDLSDLVRRFNREVHGRFRELLLARRHEFTHLKPEMAIDTGLLWVSAALRETILFGQPVSELRSPGDDELVDELSLGYAAYLGVSHPPAS